MPVYVLEDPHGFLLHHEMLWAGGDTDIAVPMIEAAQARLADLRACSFDRGFHSPAFVEARRQHPAVESAVHNLEHHGLDRVRACGADGFARVVALSVLAFNLRRLGLLLRCREQRRARRRAAA